MGNGKKTAQSRVGRRLAICLIACAAAIFCRFWYPEGKEALSEIVFGSPEADMVAAFGAAYDALVGQLTDAKG
jgi:hypothetical protein